MRPNLGVESLEEQRHRHRDNDLPTDFTGPRPFRLGPFFSCWLQQYLALAKIPAGQSSAPRSTANPSFPAFALFAVASCATIPRISLIQCVEIEESLLRAGNDG